MNWLILTGEYPPQAGGVSDYTHQVAERLQQFGDGVQVFVPRSAALTEGSAVSHVHVLKSHFGLEARHEVEMALSRTPEPRRMLIQYVPHAYGMRAMNVGFARWVRKLGRGGTQIDVLYHEVAYPIEAGQPLKHRFLAFVTRRMARWVADGAARIFVTIPAWERTLKQIGVRKDALWLPVPATLPDKVDPVQVETLRNTYGSVPTIAHFGTYGVLVVQLLEGALLQVADRLPSCRFLLLGRGGDAYAAQLIARRPKLADRITAPGEMSAETLATHLAASDLMLQPYLDGLSCRRTSAMAGLALGVPIVSALEHSSETIWADSGAVILAKSIQADDLADAVESALKDMERTRSIGLKGREMYRERFTIGSTIAKLRASIPN